MKDELDIPATKIKEIYENNKKEKLNKQSYKPEKLDTLRKRILAVSLFPNLYNKKTLLK